MKEDELETFLKSFALRCKKCGSGNVVMSISEYGGCGPTLTGHWDGEISVGCNNCKQNDHAFTNDA